MRRFLICAVLIASLVGLAPWALYGIGLNNIEGRPIPPTAASPNLAREDALGHGQSALHVGPISPWGYVLAIAGDDPRALEAERAASIIARDYNVSHLRKRENLWWDLSGAALTIWITRNWTSDQIVRGASERSTQAATRQRDAPN